MLICLGNGVGLSGVDLDGEALQVGLLRGGARVRHAPKNRHNRIDGSSRPRPSARFPFPSWCCASRAPRASREPTGSPIALRQPPAPPFARRPRRSRRPAKHGDTKRGVATCSRVQWCFPWITHRRSSQCLGTSEHAVKTHLWIAKQGLPLDRQRVCEILKIPSVALFARVPLHQLRTPPPRYSDADFEPIPLVLL